MCNLLSDAQTMKPESCPLHNRWPMLRINPLYNDALPGLSLIAWCCISMQHHEKRVLERTSNVVKNAPVTGFHFLNNNPLYLPLSPGAQCRLHAHFYGPGPGLFLCVRMEWPSFRDLALPCGYHTPYAVQVQSRCTYTSPCI